MSAAGFFGVGAVYSTRLLIAEGATLAKYLHQPAALIQDDLRRFGLQHLAPPSDTRPVSPDLEVSSRQTPSPSRTAFLRATSLKSPVCGREPSNLSASSSLEQPETGSRLPRLRPDLTTKSSHPEHPLKHSPYLCCIRLPHRCYREGAWVSRFNSDRQRRQFVEYS